MKPDLDLVIKALEKEKKTLEHQIKNSLSEYDYLIAYYHSEALSRLNHHLHILYSFKDPLHSEKERLKHIESNFRKKPDTIKDKASWKRIKERWQDRIKNDKTQLLEKEKNLNKFFNDTQEIDDAIFNLYEEKCNGFKLKFGDDYLETELNFFKKNNKLIITINPYDDLYEPDFVFDNRTPNPYHSLGFKYNEIDHNEMYEYDMTGFSNAWPINYYFRVYFLMFIIYTMLANLQNLSTINPHKLIVNLHHKLTDHFVGDLYTNNFIN